MMLVSIIAAVSRNLVIGRNNALPWHLPADMEHFKNTTTGHHVIMGRKNYDTIPEKFRPLPHRINIIVTKNEKFTASACIIVHSVEEGIETARKAGETEAFIIGGGEIYQYTLEHKLADRLYLTEVEAIVEGDTFFPEIDFSFWREISRKERKRDAKNPYDCVFRILEKKVPSPKFQIQNSKGFLLLL